MNKFSVTLYVTALKACAFTSIPPNVGALLLFFLLAMLCSCRGSETTRPPATMQPQPSVGASAPTANPSSEVGATARPVPTISGMAGADWPTYHRDAARTGAAPESQDFSMMHEVWRSNELDGDIYAEPLVVGGQVLVATENDSLYSLDASTGNVTWRSHLGEPVPRSSLQCGNISMTGITGTPVADPSGGRLYAVAFVQPGRHELVALDLASGAVRVREAIDPNGADPLSHQQRAALALSHGLVYVGFGGLFGDCGNYHGWVVAANAEDASMRYAYQVPTQREGGIWAPSGPAIDVAGNVYVATGNGSSMDASAFDFGNAVLRLTPDLRLQDWFAPSNWVELNRTDADIGSVGPTLIEDGLLFQIGKSGVGYLLRTDHLGQIGGQLFSGPVCRSAYGGTAYAEPFLYVPCSDGLVALRLQGGSAFVKAWQAAGFFAGPPIVAGGAVWTIGRDGTLYALDPADGQVRSRTSVGDVMHFATPSAAGRQLFVPTARRILAMGPD